MSFDDCDVEIRGRFGEASAFLNHLRQIAPEGFSPLDDLQKSMRALCLVTVYAAFERSVNLIVESAVAEISACGVPSIDCIPSMQGVIHFAKLQSLHQGSAKRIFDTSSVLFEASLSSQPAKIVDNPLAEKLQNVDGSTLVWIAQLFGVRGFACEAANAGRLGTLRERRNAVAHGREAASKVGERYTLDELARVYGAADAEITRFRLAMHDQCTNRGYVRRVA